MSTACAVEEDGLTCLTRMIPISNDTFRRCGTLTLVCVQLLHARTCIYRILLLDCAHYFYRIQIKQLSATMIRVETISHKPTKRVWPICNPVQLDKLLTMHAWIIMTPSYYLYSLQRIRNWKQKLQHHTWFRMFVCGSCWSGFGGMSV